MQLRNLLLASTLLAGCATDPADGVTTQDITYNGIDYHGGVLLGKPNVHVIWYGGWSALDPVRSQVPNLIANLGGTRYWGIEQTYTNSAGNRISNAVTLSGQTSVGYPLGSHLPAIDTHLGFSLTGVGEVVYQNILTSGNNPDDDGIYLVLASADVTETDGDGSFCNEYLGYHSHLRYYSDPLTYHNVKFAFVGDPSRQCPRGLSRTDSMASVIAHELAETVTDPISGGWWRNPGPADGNENGDLCEFEPLVPQTIGGLTYQLPPIWVNAFGGKCSTGVARVSITTPYDAAEITSTTPGLSCASKCTSFFEQIGTYTLTAHVAAGATFSGWSGCDSSSGTTCTISTAKDHDVKPLVCNRAGFTECLSECFDPYSVCVPQCQAEWGC